MPDRIFLDWSKPTAVTVAQWLIRAAGPGRIADLSDALVIVPTKQAGRRLRSALADAAPAGVLSPRVITPSQLLEPAPDAIAGRIESLLAVIAALDEIPAGELTPLFPHGLPFHTFEERVQFARSFLDLRATLIEGNWTLRAAAELLGDHPDSERWQVLTRLEGSSASRLRGKAEWHTARLALSHRLQLPAESRRVVVAGVADLSALVERALSSLPTGVALSILIPGPSEAFDAWGRPAADWLDRAPGWDRFDGQVHLCAREGDIAAALSAILPTEPSPDPAYLEIGALDRGLLPSLRAGLAAAGGQLHDPEGEPVERHWVARFLDAWARLLDEATFPAACDLLRHGAFAEWLSGRDRVFDLAEALAEADAVRAKFFPPTIDSALARCKPDRSLAWALGRLLDIRAAHLDREWLPSLRDFLVSLAGADMPDPILSILEEISPLTARQPSIRPPEWLRLARTALAGQQAYLEAQPGAIDASGWLELPWSDAPHLVLAGFNQGLVPARLAPDPFLTRALRARLGLPGEDQRTARDSYFLARLLAMRRERGGRVDVLVSQIDADGAPCQPSPLLFTGAKGDDLPHRVRRLFADPRPAEADPPWESVWTLDPPRIELKKSLRVTGFREYLACPFEFYLRFGLDMDFFDPEPAEMDARVFGTLVHDTIEAFSRDKTSRDLVEPGDIGSTVSRLLDALVKDRFETPLSLPLLVQVESARQRLMAFAEVQAEERRDGWRIMEAEITFAEFRGAPWVLDGWEIRGKIDRIDYHEATDRWRVLDYKTTDKAEPPERMHLRGGSERDWPPDYARVGSLSKWWTNLQLPLYRQLIVDAGRRDVSCGYFNLPKAVTATGVSVWPDFGDDLAASALGCAQGVISDVERGRFWPPNPHNPYPQNAGWFHPDPERTVAAASWLRTETA